MRVIELSKGHVAIVDDEDFTELAQYHWGLRKFGKSKHTYAYRRPRQINGMILPEIAMHREVMERANGIIPKGMHVDHINGNGLDNRRSNLRLATLRQNLANTGATKISKTGVKGVTQFKLRGKDTGRFCAKFRHKHIGIFKTISEAKEAYNRAAVSHYGEFAKLN